MIVDHYPAWEGVVQGLAINWSLAKTAIPACSSFTTLPIIQDNDTGGIWSALGSVNGVIVVDKTGIIVLRLPLLLFPDSIPEIETAVNNSL
jgi:hypothetical protein